MSQVCVDAGLLVKFITPEADSSLVEALFTQWENDDVEMIAPSFASAEVDSVLRQKVVRSELTAEIAEKAFRVALQLPITFDLAEDCRERAWEIAKTLGFPTVYDSVYLALAEKRACEFWTADKRLYERAKKYWKFARLLEA
jgi:predicted nucleic acid-binding protein